MKKLSDYDQGFADALKYSATLNERTWAVERAQLALCHDPEAREARAVISFAEKLTAFVGGNSASTQARRQSPPRSKQYASKRGSA